MEWLARETKHLGPVEGFDHIVSQFLAARGFKDSQEAHQFIHFNLKNISDPLTMKGMDLAVERLVLALKEQQAVCIYGDFDMDGTPALALVYRSLKGLGFNNVYYCQPDRHKDGYGFHTHLAQKFIDQNQVKVFITVDVGITDCRTVEQIQSQGVDVILTDHHQVQDETPKALAIVNPNQPDCQAQLGHLCGTGVGFYLVMALRRSLKDQGLLTTNFDIKSVLDCFAIGTIADLVPLIKENRILVKHGLKVLENTSMIGIKMLLDALKMSGKTLGAQDVGIRFVPKLNSLTRLDVELKPIDLFLVEDPAQAALMVQTVLKNNDQRVLLLDEAENLLEAMVQQKQNDDVLFFWSEHFHKGLVGLLASQLVNKFNRPAFVGALTPNGMIVGSARAPDSVGANVFLALQSASAHLNKFGGHPAAAGFELDPQNTDKFQTSLNQFFSQVKIEEGALFYDQVVDFHGIKNFMKWWDQLEPFGQNFTTPQFRIDKLKPKQITVLKKVHLKISFVDSSGFLMECVWFYPEDIDFFKKHEGKEFSLLCEPQWNEFMGSRRIQLLLKDIKGAD